MKREELLKALEMIKPGVDDKDKANLGQDNCLFSGDTVSSFNNDIAITYPIDSGIKALVRAMDLISILKKLRKISETVKIESISGKIMLTTSSSKNELATIEDPVVEERLLTVHKAVSDLKWMKLPVNFIDNLHVCAMAASKKESQFTLACVYAEGVNMIGSDNDKVAWATLDAPVKKMLIRASCVKSIININPIQYSGDSAFYHFKNEDGAIVSIRRVTGEYPIEYMNFFDFQGQTFSIPNEALGGIELASVFVDEKAPTISVQVHPGRCIISSGVKRGSSKFRVDISYKGEPFTFHIDPDVFKELLKHNTEITVGDNVAKIVVDDSNLKMLTTLILE